MAYNVREEWFLDESGRRSALIKAVASRPKDDAEQADGMAMRAWRLARRFWEDGRRLIPEEDWRRADLEVLIDCGLAERRSGGIYVKGTFDCHDWVHKKSKAGHASAEARRKKYGSAQPKKLDQTSNSPEQPRTRVRDAFEKTGEDLAEQNHWENLEHIEQNSNSLEPFPFPVSLKDKDLNNRVAIHTSSGDDTRPPAKPKSHPLFEIWNANCGQLPKAKSLSAKRLKRCQKALALEPDLGYWVQVVQRIAASKFCLGGGTTGWIAGFDWLLQDDVHLRVMEGRYDRTGASKSGRTWDVDTHKHSDAFEFKKLELGDANGA